MKVVPTQSLSLARKPLLASALTALAAARAAAACRTAPA